MISMEIVYYDSMDWDTGINVGMIAVDSVASEFIISVGTPILLAIALLRR